MKIAGTYTFPASRDEVWAAINDPEVLARSIPGCQKLDQVGEHEFESTLKVGLQAVKGVYNGRVVIDDLQPPAHYRIAVDGKGTNGFMKGSGSIDLQEDGENTILKYAGDAQIGGTLASVGQRLIDGASKTLINQSLKALAQQIELRKNGGSGTDSGAPGPLSDATPPAEPAVDAATSNTTSSNDLGKNAIATLDHADTVASETTVSGNGSPVPEPALSSVAATTLPTPVSEKPRPATTTMLSTNPLPPTPSASARPAPAESDNGGFQRRTVVVPAHEQLSETAVMQGMVTDFISERPWISWVIVAFLLGFLLGRRG